MAEESNPHLLADSERVQRAADVLKTVAHPARLEIINYLEAGEQSVAKICERLNAPQPSVSRHLNLMKAKGILFSKRKGNQVLYSVANRSMIEVIHCIRKHGNSPEGCAALASGE